MAADYVLHWFRQDLRLSDNPALTAAAAAGEVVPLYIADDVNSGEYYPGAASQLWLHHSLSSLQERLNNQMLLHRGDPLTIIPALCRQHGIRAVYWNRCYEPWQIDRDKQLKVALTEMGVTVHSENGALLWEPWTITKADGTPYKVFTPFYRRGCLAASPPRSPLPVPPKLALASIKCESNALASLALLPQLPWGEKVISHWKCGEVAAQQRLNHFISEGGLSNYKRGRDFPAQHSVSGLSPHLHFGEISPHQAWSAVTHYGNDDNTDHFCSELGWREFSYSQLYYFPELPKKNWQSYFDAFPWQTDANKLRAWQRGLTGVPLVDAGMRQLWQTGYVHNRIRMVVASFLVKNLLLDWRLGERWFWDCLCDADLASNSAGWQWVAGSGADAAPYFRIFNPVTQSQKFDPNGEYIKHYVPELTELPARYIGAPWLAPASTLAAAGITLGEHYPRPIVDLAASRKAALAAYQHARSER